MNAYDLIDSSLKLFLGVFCGILVIIAIWQIIHHLGLIADHFRAATRRKRREEAERIARRIYGEEDDY